MLITCAEYRSQDQASFKLYWSRELCVEISAPKIYAVVTSHGKRTVIMFMNTKCTSFLFEALQKANVSPTAEITRAREPGGL
jgi:hypothetical protein